MQKIILTQAQALDIKMALLSHYYYLADEHKIIQDGLKSPLLHAVSYESWKESLHSDVIRNEVILLINKMEREFQTFKQLIPDQDSYDLTVEQVELIHEALDYYSCTVLATVIKDMESNPGCIVKSPTLLFPALENEHLYNELYLEFYHRGRDVSFFIMLREHVRQIQYFLRGHFSNCFPKSESRIQRFFSRYLELLSKLDDATKETILLRHPIFSHYIKSGKGN